MTAAPVIYSGQAFSSAGDKGRFVLPPSFRKTVKESSGGRVLCIAKHPELECLQGFGLGRVEAFPDILEQEAAEARERGQPLDRARRKIQLYSFAEVGFDDSGRFVLPAALGGLVGIDEEIFFLASGEFFTLWSPVTMGDLGPEWGFEKALCEQYRAEARGRARK